MAFLYCQKCGAREAEYYGEGAAPERKELTYADLKYLFQI